VRDLHLLIHTVALAASGIVLGFGIWQGADLWIVAKKMAAAYLASFCLAVLAVLAVRASVARKARTAAPAAPEGGPQAP